MPMTGAERDAILAALIAEDGPWDPAATFVGVADSVTDNGLATVIGDVNPAPTSLAVRQAITTWSTPHIKADGRAMVDSPVKIFKPTSTGDATTIGAIFIATAITAGVLMFFENLGTPIPLPGPTTSMSVVVRLVVDPLTGTWTANIIFNG